MRAKRTLRPWVDRAADLSGVLGYTMRKMNDGLTVLMYHRVLEDEKAAHYPIPQIAMAESVFREHLDWLVKHVRLLPLAQGMEELQRTNRQHSTRPLVAITFDDGYLDNYDFVAPLLEQAGIRGTFFICTGISVQGKGYWFDRAATQWETEGPSGCRSLHDEVQFSSFRGWLDYLKQLSPSALEQLLRVPAEALSDQRFGVAGAEKVADLADRGHEIGAHTVTHPLLPGLPEQALHDELHASKTLLEQWTGQTVRTLCYPNGSHDDRVVAATKQVGYQYAVTIFPGLHRRESDPFRIARRDITLERVGGLTRSSRQLSFRSEVTGFREVFR